MARKTVLVVEDHADLRGLFTDALTMAGFAVRSATNGIEALRFLDAAPPAIVVLDLGLPHVTGFDVLFELKEHAHTRNIPVVVVTGREGPLEGVSASCLLRKPVELDELVRAVQRCLAPEDGRSQA